MFLEGQRLSDFTQKGFQQKEAENEAKARRLQNQMKNYEFTTKNLHESVKILDYFSSILSQSLDNERVYIKNQQKLINSQFNSSNSMVNFIKFNQQYNDLFQIMQEDILHNFNIVTKRHNLQKQLTEVFQDEIRQIQEKMKKYDNEVKLLDKTTNGAFQKMSKIREKFLKVAREEEMSFIQLDSMEQNKEQNQNSSATLKIKNQQQKICTNLYAEKIDLDKQLKQFQQAHSQAALLQSHEVNNKNDVLYLDHEKMRQKTGQIFNELIKYKLSQIQEQAEFLQEKKKKVDFIQISRQNLFKELLLNYNQYEDKSHYFINEWKPFCSFLTNSVEKIRYRMDKRKNKPKFNHELDYEDQTFISKEFKDYLQSFFKVHINQFGKDLITLKHQYFKIVKELYEALEDNEQNSLANKNQMGLSKSQEKEKKSEKLNIDDNNSNSNNENNKDNDNNSQKQGEIINNDQKDQEDENTQNEQKITDLQLNKDPEENGEVLEEDQQTYNSPKQKFIQDEKIEQFELELGEKEKDLTQFYQANYKIHINIKYVVICLFYYTHPQNQQKMTEFDKYYLQDLLHKQLYRRTLVSGIQAFRNYGIKKFEYAAFQNLFRLFNRCLKVCYQVKDCWAATKLMVMSCTLYTMEDQKNSNQSTPQKQQQQQQSGSKNLYVSEVITNNPIWKSQDLWENMIYDTILDELDKQFPDSVLKNMDQCEYGLQYKQLVQSNLLSVAANMQTFKINKENTKAILTKFGQYFGLFEIQIQEIAKFADFDASKGQGSAFLKGPSSLSVMNNFYSNQSQLRSKDNDNTLVNIINDSLKKGEYVQPQQVQNQSQFKSRVFTFGGSKSKD